MSAPGWRGSRSSTAVMASGAIFLLLLAPVHALAAGLPLCCRLGTRCEAGDHCSLAAAPTATEDSCHAAPGTADPLPSDRGTREPVARSTHIGTPSYCAAPCGTLARTLPAHRQDPRLAGAGAVEPARGFHASIDVRDHRSLSILTVQSWRGPPSPTAV